MMEVSITDITDVEKEIRIQAPTQVLSPHFERAYKEHLPKAEIKGFRKGKVPLDLVRKLFGESIEYNALDKIASEIFREVVTERHIHPIGEPTLTDIDYRRGEALTFSVKYQVKPQIQLKEYKGVAVEKMIHPVNDAEVAEEIARLRRTNSTLTDVTTVTDSEHVVTADIQQLDESGTPLIGKKTADAQLYLADESVYAPIREALSGATINSPRQATIEVENDGKKEVNRLELIPKKIQKVHLPQLDDEFVRKVTKDKVTSAEEFKTQLRNDLEQYWKERSERQLMDSIVAEIVGRHDFAVPESLIKGFQDSMVEELKARYPNKNPPKEFKESEFREHNRGYAIFQSKWYLIREQIIIAEGLTATDEDLEKMAELDAPKMGIEKERLLSFYKTSDAVSDRILSEKLNAFLKLHASITEKVTEEIPE